MAGHRPDSRLQRAHQPWPNFALSSLIVVIFDPGRRNPVWRRELSLSGRFAQTHAGKGRKVSRFVAVGLRRFRVTQGFNLLAMVTQNVVGPPGLACCVESQTIDQRFPESLGQDDQDLFQRQCCPGQVTKQAETLAQSSRSAGFARQQKHARSPTR
jgi:hypothetical protein